MANKGRRFPGQVLAREELRSLIAACGRGRTGLRARALLVLLWRGGLRISEALALTPLDVELEAGLVRVRRGKGGYPRTVALDAKALEVIERWRRRRSELHHGDQVPLLCTRKGTPMSTAACRTLIYRLAARAGIRHRVHLHALRHSYAVHALEDGVPLPVVQAQLGHRNMATTGIYLRHVTDERLVEYARGRAW